MTDATRLAAIQRNAEDIEEAYQAYRNLRHIMAKDIRDPDERTLRRNEQYIVACCLADIALEVPWLIERIHALKSEAEAQHAADAERLAALVPVINALMAVSPEALEGCAKDEEFKAHQRSWRGHGYDSTLADQIRALAWYTRNLQVNGPRLAAPDAAKEG